MTILYPRNQTICHRSRRRADNNYRILTDFSTVRYCQSTAINTHSLLMTYTLFISFIADHCLPTIVAYSMDLGAIGE